MDRSKKRINKSAKRDNLLFETTSDVRFDNQKKVFGPRRFLNPAKGPKPSIKAIEVSPPKLMGHFQCDRYGKNLVLDGCGGIRVYNLPVERKDVAKQNKDSDIEEVVDDWEQLVENESNDHASIQTVIIPECNDLNFDLLNGYVPLKDGGNKVSFSGTIRDRTAGMRWLIKHHQNYKCDDGKRLFDIDFFAGNGAMRSIMTSQFSQYEEVAHIGVTLFKGTYFMYDVGPSDERDGEVDNKRSFAGLRFEDFVSRGMNGEESGPSSGEQNNYGDSIKYHNVVQFNFHNFKMLVCGEVDCVIPGSSAALGKKPKVDDFIEIKTSAPLEDRYDPSRKSIVFRCGKISSWYAQCILMGVKHVVVGIRDEKDECDKITVNRTHSFTLEELRQNSNGFWSKNRCFDDLRKFLCFVKEKVTVDDPEIINVFVVRDGVISDPVKKKYEDDPIHFPDNSEVVKLMNKL
ncbi:hypothetical protein HA402_014884 [Bradysia odoriphaga]|nr:hypothetical protein HA402_014884 [Bradysia odoriphaga]